MKAEFLLLLVACLALPQLLPLGRVAPRLAAGVWLATLALRALTALVVIAIVVALVPSTGVFATLTSWCWHLASPLLAGHLRLSGDAVGHAATLAPAALLAGSALSAAWAIACAARAVRKLVGQHALGHGPHGTVIVGGPDVVIAAAGLTRPRIVVSAGALTDLDDAELAASIEHERGHLAHRHRYALLCGEVCRAVSCCLPGGHRALSELAFHLERDADEYALGRRHTPLALASAICKALPGAQTTNALMALGGGPSVLDRVRALVDGVPARGRAATRAAGLCAVLTATLTIALSASLPAVAAAGANQLSSGIPGRHCPA